MHFPSRLCHSQTPPCRDTGAVVLAYVPFREVGNFKVLESIDSLGYLHILCLHHTWSEESWRGFLEKAKLSLPLEYLECLATSLF